MRFERYIFILLLFAATPASGFMLDFYNCDNPSLLENVEQHHLYRNPYLGVKEGVKQIIAEKKFVTAANELRYVLERVPNHPRALEYVAQVSEGLKDPLMGFFYFKRAVTIYPQYAYTHFQFGSYLLDVGNVDESIAELNISVRMDPSLGSAYAVLAKAYERKGEIALARKAEEQAKALGYKGVFPDNTAGNPSPGTTD